MLHPPYTVTEEEVRVIVRELRAALDEVFVN
jgi:adenosylmethionine-8-amino-7-oxononanoate aminotransferase